jgi:hypothetical protein
MVRNDLSEDRLYNLADDPGERHDLASRRPEVVTRMRDRVRRTTGGRPPLYSSAAIEATPRRL